MSDTRSAVAYRHLGSVAALANLLSDLEPNLLSSGAIVWVEAEANFYRYEPTSTATASGDAILVTQYGASVAGRWFRGLGAQVASVPTVAVVAFGSLIASGVTSASIAFAGLAVNDVIALSPRSALAQEIAYARCATADQLIVALGNDATTTVAAQTITFDVVVLRN